MKIIYFKNNFIDVTRVIFYLFDNVILKKKYKANGEFQDFIAIKQDVIVPFLDALQSVVTDSEAVADHAAKSCRVHTEENINILLNDPQIIEQT
ncbi:hypothetical protein ACGP04_10725 [Piscirickettsia salmonis]|uniref:hypothetical protein n=1 Tax=Piscirickettsia salmonis TaxID=1238 RepID=UPI000F082DE0|nr:hypothetical protein DA717_15120 [Piscirickettsiaceae bacterium NZ-RLO2]